MKILLYSHTFWPNVGGVEDIGHALAKGCVEFGHQVTVVTPTPSLQERPVNYTIVRNPAWRELIQLVRSHEIIHANGSTVRLFPLAVLFNKPFTWTHHGYQLQCIDGAGWVNGRPAPMQPWPSIWYHVKVSGWFKGIIGGIKLWGRRLVGFLVTANIASSKHVACRQPLPRQRMIYNPFDQERFAARSLEEARGNFARASTTFTFAGRLITEKGVDDLLYALHDLNQREHRSGKESSTLTLIGDGPEKLHLQDLSKSLALEGNVTWEYYPSDKMPAALEKAGIGLIPSAWEEPGAVIVLQFLSAGKPLIVSERGWLAECAGDACLSFPNQNRLALADAMDKLSNDNDLQLKLLQNALRRRKEFDSNEHVKSYLKLFSELTGKT